MRGDGFRGEARRGLFGTRRWLRPFPALVTTGPARREQAFDIRAGATAMQALDTAERERVTASEEVAPPTTNEPSFTLTAPHSSAQMHVTKRNGGQETVDVNKIVRAVTRSAKGLHGVDPLRVALKIIGGLYDGATTGAGSTLDPHCRQTHRRGTRVRPARRAPAWRLHRQGCFAACIEGLFFYAASAYVY